MGGTKSKIEITNANVINNVEVIGHTPEINSVWLLLLILTIISAFNLILKLYILHKRSLRKKYASRADNLDKI